MNNVILIGRFTDNADVRYTTPSNGEEMCIARYRLAVDRPGKDKGADFISCVAFGKQGEFVEKYTHKGMKIAVEGRIQTGSYKNKEGKTVYTTDVVVERHEFCEKRGEGSSDESTQEPPVDGDGFVDVPEGIEGDLPFK